MTTKIIILIALLIIAFTTIIHCIIAIKNINKQKNPIKEVLKDVGYLKDDQE